MCVQLIASYLQKLRSRAILTPDNYQWNQQVRQQTSTRQMTTKWNYLSIQRSWFPRDDFFLEDSQALPIYPTGNSTHIDENYYRSLVERYWQRKSEVFGENPDPMPLFPPQISHGLTSIEAVSPRRALHTFYQHGNNPNPSLRIHLLTPVTS